METGYNRILRTIVFHYKKKSPSKEMNCGGAEVAVTISKLYIYIYIYIIFISILKKFQTYNGHQ